MRPSKPTSHHHSIKFESPLPLYIGLKVHTLSRSKKLISELSQLGLSVCYDWVIQLEKQIASFLCEHSNETGVVCPSQLRHDLFTVGALDNIDINNIPPNKTLTKQVFYSTKRKHTSKVRLGKPTINEKSEISSLLSKTKLKDELSELQYLHNLSTILSVKFLFRYHPSTMHKGRSRLGQ